MQSTFFASEKKNQLYIYILKTKEGIYTISFPRDSQDTAKRDMAKLKEWHGGEEKGAFPLYIPRDIYLAWRREFIKTPVRETEADEVLKVNNLFLNGTVDPSDLKGSAIVDLLREHLLKEYFSEVKSGDTSKLTTKLQVRG